MIETITLGKGQEHIGASPAVILYNPKFSHNVGAAMRAASCFGVEQVWFTGDRVSLESKKGARLPREERMKGYSSVELRHYDRPFDCFTSDIVPVAVEITETSEQLPTFVHPERAVYVFGPEDGSIPSKIKRHCHRHVMIPTRHCTNLAAAVYIVMYDRLVKRQALGLEPVVATCDLLNEDRGWSDPTDLWGVDGQIGEKG